MKFDYPIGATPLDPDELEGLIPTHIRTQAELNEWESSNIRDAEFMLLSLREPTVLSMQFILKLHTMMFDKTWSWA
jgi:fido (protein-threonine AMPylation protein)